MRKIQIEKDLNEYKEITLELFDRIKINGDRLFLLKKREEIIDKIKESCYDEIELAEIYMKLEISKLDKQLEIEVKKEIVDLKKRIMDLKKRRQGSRSYITNIYGGCMFSVFDKKY